MRSGLSRKRSASLRMPLENVAENVFRVEGADGTRARTGDGPEFDGHKVDFDELMGRLNAYWEEEAIADSRFEHQIA